MIMPVVDVGLWADHPSATLFKVPQGECHLSSFSIEIERRCDRPGSTPCAVPRMKTRLMTPCTACVGLKEFPPWYRSRPRDGTGHDGGFFTGNRPGFILQLPAFADAVIFSMTAPGIVHPR